MFSKKALKCLKDHKVMEKFNKYEVKYISELNGDLGSIEGIDFDSQQCGGYLYFWSTGYVSFIFYDYCKDEEIIKDTLIESSNIDEVEENLKELFVAI